MSNKIVEVCLLKYGIITLLRLKLINQEINIARLKNKINNKWEDYDDFKCKF